MIKEIILKLVEGKNLSELESMKTIEFIMDGKATDAQIGSFMTALRIKGETIEEITACAKVMRQKSEKIYPKVDYFIDTCGTGGDCTNTFNISTAAALVAAAGKVVVAKHGNRSVSSKCGSADVLEALGINIDLTPDRVTDCIEKVGIGFMFSPLFHKSMKYASAPRKETGLRTIFNILGPLVNPASAKGQLMGVFDSNLTEVMAKVLVNLGIEKALVIHGLDGMDEITTTAHTKVTEVIDKKVLTYELYPELFGFKTAKKEDLMGGDAKENANIILSIFKGEQGPKREIVILNAAASLYLGKVEDSISDGVNTAMNIIDSGRALRKLEELREFTNLKI